MKLYNIIFFYIYRSLLKSNLRDSPVLFATMMFSGLQSFTIFAFIKILEGMLNTKITPNETGTFELIVFYVLVLIPNLIYIYTKKKYSKIIEQLGKADEKTWKRRRFFVILYVALTFLFVFASVSLR